MIVVECNPPRSAAVLAICACLPFLASSCPSPFFLEGGVRRREKK